jgi:hypothetical protein
MTRRFERLLHGGHLWGYLRLGLAVLCIYLFASLGRSVWAEPGTEPVSFMKMIAGRYWVFPIAGFLGALLVGINYLVKLYQLPRLRLAFRYMIASAFGIGYPRLVVENGEKVLEPDEINLVDVIGGPGIVDVRSGSAVMLEYLTSPSRALGAGRHFLSRLEHVREVVSLEDQHGEIAEVVCTTKDGIGVRVMDVQYRYRLRTGHLLGDYQRRTPQEPYPFSIQAMKNMAYNRSVGPAGLQEWAEAVRVAVDGVITDYVRQHQFDQLTTPQEIDERARERVNLKLNAASTRSRLNNLGAELLWCDIGHIEAIDPRVSEMRVGKWGVRWTGEAKITLAYGEAQRKAHQELGRAEAQANLLVSVVKALEDVSLGDDPKENLHNIVVMRTAQVLEAMTEHEQSDE